jgi:hypothetical protein
LGTGIFVAIAMVAATAWYMFPRPGRAAVTAIINDAGYLGIVPPNTFNGPGTINTVEFLDGQQVRLLPTCDAHPELLVDKIQKSPTIDRDWQLSIEKKLSASEEFRDKLNAGAGINEISSIHLKLENTTLLSISDESMLVARKALLKDACEDAVLLNISSGGLVCQTRSVLEANLVYEISYKDTVSVEERAKLTSAVAAKLNLDASAQATDRISGAQLFFGVILAPNAIIAGPKPGTLKCTHLSK